VKNTPTTFESQVKDFSLAEKSRTEQVRRFMTSNPSVLVVGGYGEYLRVKQNRLEICHGDDTPISYKKVTHGLKQIIYILSIGSVSDRVLNWIKEEKIHLVVFNMYGESQKTIENNCKPNLKLRNAQYALTQEQKLELCTIVLKQKILAQAEVLKKHSVVLCQAEKKASEVASMASWFTNIPWFQEYTKHHKVLEQNTMMVKEALAAEIYYESWKDMPVHWSAKNASKVPTDWKVYYTRSDGARNARNAQHPVNAMLNFAYYLLAEQIKLACLTNGLDIYKSFLHAEHEDRTNLVYDLIEPLRPMVDDIVLSYIEKYSLYYGDFTEEKSTSVVRLAPHAAKSFAAYVASKLDSNAIHIVVNEYCQFLTESQSKETVKNVA
jgi:CRISP-associated protein Cas1